MTKTIYLWTKEEYRYPCAGGFLPNITAYLHDDEKLRPAMLVVPGGGYALVSPTEGEIVAKKFFEEGLIYDGLKILPYCPRCGTGLASHEVAQGYKEISVNTVTVPFKMKDEENTYLLIWTTTPWTLISNVAACVNPKEKYVKCLSKGYHFIVAEKLAHSLLYHMCRLCNHGRWNGNCSYRTGFWTR